MDDYRTGPAAGDKIFCVRRPLPFIRAPAFRELSPPVVQIAYANLLIQSLSTTCRRAHTTGPAPCPVAYNMIESVISKCAAQVKDGPCTGYVGSLGAENYVKMIHVVVRKLRHLPR